MNHQSVHEPEAQLMSAEDVWEDTVQLAELYRQHDVPSEPVIHAAIPLSSFLAVIDHFSHSEIRRDV